MAATTRDRVLRKMLARALSGEGAHVRMAHVFEGVDWKLAGKRPMKGSRTLFELLNHIVYWQDWVLRWLDGDEPKTPNHAAKSWPGGAAPVSAAAWKRALSRYDDGLTRLAERTERISALFAQHGGRTALGMLQTIASHNSYHAGQAVAVRQALGAWPPPSGGLTW